ncbi:MAG: aryl-sulfate sulfotransferase [Acidobacteriia bacterium]|nr:aryl-sulfate sulfotransferase [Terriglobia bacterium]
MKPQLFLSGALLACAALYGCALTSSHADFSIEAAPSSITVIPGGAAQTLSIGVSQLGGASQSVTVTAGAVPAGVTVTPATFSLTIGSLAQISVSASAAAVPGAAGITFTGTSGSLTHETAVSMTIASASTTASLSAASYDFGNNLVNNTVTGTVVTVSNTGSAPLTLDPALTGDPSYTIVSGLSCGTNLAPGAHCDMVLNYLPAAASAPAAQMAMLNMGFDDVPAGTPQTVAISGKSFALPAGIVAPTDNPQVALYTMTLPFPGSVTIHFGTTAGYGLQTWTQSTDAPGGEVSIFVAGMLASTLYHMQAAVQFSNGIAATDADHTFTTKTALANMRITVTTTTTARMTPQPGLELLNPLAGNPSGVVVTDLSGNVLWTYANPGTPGLNFIDGVKTLPDGNFLLVIGPSSSVSLTGAFAPGTITELREVNLAGDTVREITIDDLNSELAAAGCAECAVKLDNFHHDVEPLPNGHWLAVANTTRVLSATSQPPLTGAAATTVLGDVIVDLDQNLWPVWVWNEFNHLDPNRHPMQFPDWTHTNAVVYSKDDHNILVSMRHQNWILKVNYNDGVGDGSIVWRLGTGGDFTLAGGSDPADWEFAQHAPAFFSANTAGVFSLGVMDNGDDRIFPGGVTCGSAGAPPCHFTTVPVWQIDETAKTATLTFHQILPAGLFSNFGGNAERLANGNVEYDLCSVASGPNGPFSYVYEVTSEASPQTVWSMHVSGTFLYRAFRIPSLYPGVQW